MIRNGLTILAQRMDHVRSAVVNLLIPAGFVHEPKGEEGIANVLSEMLQRGAGKLDSKAFAQALDRLGIDLDCSVGAHHLRITATGMADKIDHILGFIRDVALAAKLPASELASAKELALQELLGLDDEPRGQVIKELRSNHFPHPYGNSRYGTPEGIQAITHANLKGFWERHGHAKGSILSVAGLIDPVSVFDCVEKLFSGWAPGKETPIKLGKRGQLTAHIEKETQQTQIALAWDSVHPSHPDYYQAQGLVNVLSGGMSSRLFTEVREKQGLCYSVWATHVSLHDRGAIFAYAGTTNDRAPLTLASVKREITRITDGITKEEVDQVRVGLKSALLMQEDSSMTRAASIASDWYHLGRVRPLEEIEAAVMALTPKSILEYAKKYAPKELTQVTMGPEMGKAVAPKVKAKPTVAPMVKEVAKKPVPVKAAPVKAAPVKADPPKAAAAAKPNQTQKALNTLIMAAAAAGAAAAAMPNQTKKAPTKKPLATKAKPAVKPVKTTPKKK